MHGNSLCALYKLYWSYLDPDSKACWLYVFMKEHYIYRTTIRKGGLITFSQRAHRHLLGRSQRRKSLESNEACG